VEELGLQMLGWRAAEGSTADAVALTVRTLGFTS
jgi:hypothetical protein